MRGGKACRPLIARDGLSHALVEPGLAFLAARNAEVVLRDQIAVVEARAYDFARDKGMRIHELTPDQVADE